MNLKELTYKQKFYALGIAILLLSVLAFKKSLSPTIATVSGYYSAKKKIENGDQLQEKLALFTKQNQDLDAVIGSQMSNPVLVQNAIVEFIADRPSDIKLKAFEPMHVSRDDYFTVYSNRVTLQGGINDVLLTLYEIETQFKLSKLAHVKLSVKKNYKTRKNELFSELLFRQYEKN